MTSSAAIYGITPLVGIEAPIWTGKVAWAMPTIIVIDAWQWTPFVYLILLAGLQSLPLDVMEAARIDGASTWQRFWRITMPTVDPVHLHRCAAALHGRVNMGYAAALSYVIVLIVDGSGVRVHPPGAGALSMRKRIAVGLQNVAIVLVLIVVTFPFVWVFRHRLGGTPFRFFLLAMRTLILVYPVYMTPLVAWIMVDFFREVPREMEEAALIDGCSQWGLFWRVVVPVAILNFIGGWNEFLFALIVQTRLVRGLTLGAVQ